MAENSNKADKNNPGGSVFDVTDYFLGAKQDKSRQA